MSRYVLLPETLAAPADNPDNRCFCRDLRVTKNCTLAGALDLSSCQDGSAGAWSSGVAVATPLTPAFGLVTGKPVYISLPHFLHGSAVLQQNVLGLNPSPEHHMTYLDVEPVSSAPSGGAKLATKSDLGAAFLPDYRLHLELR